MGIQEAIGRAFGWANAPLTFFGSLIRGDRIFHPDGVVYQARVDATAVDGPTGELAQRLAGTALVRLSGGIWAWPEGQRRPDILGVAVRFRAEDNALTPKLLPGDQDLLFATSQTVPGLMIAPFVTVVDDFLNNSYYTILPFTLEGVGKVYLRLVPQQRSPAGPDRRQRLERAVAQGSAVLQLEIQAGDRNALWRSLATIELTERLPIDDDAIAFDPETSAMGLDPRGVLQWTRPMTYLASRIGWMLRRQL